jgi:hypothetical protein
MKKRLGLSLCVVALVAVFSACGTSYSGTSMDSEKMSSMYSVESNSTEESVQASEQDKPEQELDDSINNMIQVSVEEDLNLEGSDFTSESSSDTINLVTDCIKIYCSTNEFSVPIEITDMAIIDEIVSAINVFAWDRVGLENEIAASPTYYIDFCNGTVLSLLSDTGYGSVGTDFFTEFDEDGNMVAFGLENPDGPYLYNDSLLYKIKKIVAEY